MSTPALPLTEEAHAAPERRAGVEWLAVLISAGLVLAAGARLVALSVQRHAAQAHRTAQQLADRSASTLRDELHQLQASADRRAQQAAGTSALEGTAARVQSLRPQQRAFWLLAGGRVLGALPADQPAALAIAAELSQPGSTGAVIGPLRQGSRWLVAARAPLWLPGRYGSQHQAGWAVTYQDLDELLVRAQLQPALHAGYDFELWRTAEAGTLLPVTGSRTTPPQNAALASIEPPGTATGSAPLWQLGIEPRAGWYPTDELLVDVSLLLLLTWLVALAVRDVAHHLSQLRSALAVSRRRLRVAQEQLANEVEQRLRLQKSYEHAHFHDSFTGLPNRHYFLSQLDRGLRQMRIRPGFRIAVLLVAVDRFKIITDTLGRTAGDELMVQVTRLFGQALTGHDHILARWGDDELAVLINDVPDASALMRIGHTLQETLQTPLELRRHRIVVATFIGATLVESGLQRTEQVLREADIALYSARTPGSNPLVTYSSNMQHQLLHLVSLEGDLHAALERNEFRLLFQPIVDLQARHIVGMEALLRWQHPAEGLLPPDRFLSFAEESGLIVPITRWIIQRAARLSRDWRSRLPPEQSFYVSINLSPAALLDPGLVEHVASVLAETATPASCLKFELTENGLINNVGAAREVLVRLHAMGIELMLDDFGTGYSSLSHLQLFPFDYIKIDGPMDSRLDADHSLGALIRAMTQMASTLGLKTIAEIVETSAAAETLQEIGCDYAQGNAFCAPVGAEQAVRRLLTGTLGEEPWSEPSDSPTMILPVLPEQEATQPEGSRH